MMKSLCDAVFALCMKNEVCEPVLVLLCDCVDELDDSMKESVKDCVNVKGMMDRLNEELKDDGDVRSLSLILHVLNEMDAMKATSRARCREFFDQRVHEYEASHSHSLLSVKQWSDEEMVCMSESIRGVMRGDVSMDWILKVLQSMSRQPLIMNQIARRIL